MKDQFLKHLIQRGQISLIETPVPPVVCPSAEPVRIPAFLAARCVSTLIQSQGLGVKTKYKLSECHAVTMKRWVLLACPQHSCRLLLTGSQLGLGNYTLKT